MDMPQIKIINGVLNLNKPAGKSSHDMVYFIRKIYNIKKVGHTGTLDPEATGVLPMLIGSATKLSDLILNHDKKYRAVLKLGVTTDTMDATGKILKTSVNLPDFEQVKKACADFTGEIMQTPPMYSAIKINGRKLYEYARNNISLELEQRRINIYDITCGQTDKTDEYILNISCSKGTYIRALCHDLGENLNCGGIMSQLCRTRSGIFDISESYAPEYIKNLENPESVIISCEQILKNFTDKKINLDAFYSRLAKNGAEIYLKKINLSFNTGEKILMYDENNNIFAFGEIKEFADGLACKAQIFI